jgi:hypothetical protein
MKKSPIILAGGVFLIVGGVIWILQGLDVAFAPESFMTDNRWWVLWGAAAVVIGVVLLLRYRKT